MGDTNRTNTEAKQTGSRKKPDKPVKAEQLEAHIQALESALQQAQDKEHRALADYQNLVRRTRADSERMAKFATKELVSQLIQPLEHLRLAALQLQDQGLQMVVDQLWQVLEQNGLQQFEPLGEVFDVERMEAVEQQGSGNTVIKVHSCGYELHGQVIQHAKVVVGTE